MPLIYKRLQLAVKEESEEGTAEILTASEAVLAGNVVFDPDIRMVERPAAAASLSPFPKVAGARMAKITFDVELKGSGSAGTAPEYGVLLKACGMEESTVVGTSVTYDPASAAIISVTIGWYVDNKKYVMAGCRGTWKLDLKAGEHGVFHFEFTGTAIADSDVNLLTGTSLQTTIPPAFMSASFTLDTYGAVVENLSIDLANDLYLRPSVNAAQGYVSAVITGRLPKLTLDPESVLVATKDWWTSWETGALVALTATVGGTAGNICTITAPKVQFIKIKPEEKEGILADSMECELKRNSGDDEVSLAFT